MTNMPLGAMTDLSQYAVDVLANVRCRREVPFPSLRSAAESASQPEIQLLFSCLCELAIRIASATLNVKAGVVMALRIEFMKGEKLLERVSWDNSLVGAIKFAKQMFHLHQAQDGATKVLIFDDNFNMVFAYP